MSQPADDNFYHRLLGLPPDLTQPDWYELLGLPRFTDDVRRIHEAAVARNGQLRRWDNSKYFREADLLTNEVVQASQVLEDAAKKAAYDANLRDRLGLTKPEPIEEIVLDNFEPEPEPAPEKPPRRKPRDRAVSEPEQVEPEASSGRGFLVLTGVAGVAIVVGLLFLMRGRTSNPSIAATPNSAPTSTNSITPQPGSISLAPLSRVTLSPGGKTTVKLQLDRTERQGSVQVEITDPADWLSVQPRVIPAEQSTADLEVVVSEMAPAGVSRFRVEARLGELRSIRELEIAVESAEVRRWNHGLPIVSVAIGPDQRVLAASQEAILYVWDATSGDELLNKQTDSDDLRSLSSSLNGQLVAFGGADGQIRLWSLEDLGQVQERHNLPGHSKFISSVALSADGRLAISGSYDMTVRVWDMEAGSEKVVLSGHTASVTSVAMSSDGKFAVSGSDDKTVRLWDLETQREIWDVNIMPRPERHARSVSCVALSADGQLTVSGSRDGSIKLWRPRETGVDPIVLSGHARGVTCFSLSADSARLLSGGEDNLVKLWDARTGKELGRLAGHTASVAAVAFAPDGKQAVSGSKDGTVRLWKLPANVAAP